MWWLVLLITVPGAAACLAFAWAMAEVEEITRRLQRDRVIACPNCGHQCFFVRFKKNESGYTHTGIADRVYNEYPVYVCVNCKTEIIEWLSPARGGI